MEGYKFSIVIPLAPERNAEILNSIKEIDYPKSEFHVIVVRGRNPSENRNKGALRAEGEIIVFLDDDAVVDKEILKKAEDFFSKHGEIDIVGGPQLTPLDEKGFAKISGYALSSRFGAWKMANRYAGKELQLRADETMLTSANLFCRKEVMKRIQFNPFLFPGEDPKFIEDAQKSGFRVAYSPDLIVYHRRRADWKSLTKQIYTYGKTRTRKETLKETIKRPFFLIPSIFVIYILVLLLTAISNTAITGSVVNTGGVSLKNIYFLLWIPFLLYFLLTLVFSFINARVNENFIALFVLPFIYLTIHLSYGMGFLYGLFLKVRKCQKKEK